MKLLTALVVTAALALLAVPGVLANGAPVKIPLTRLPGVVNFADVPTARGEAQITAVEGDVSLIVTGLDRLQSELYQGWLVNTKTGDRLSVAKFNVTADGTAKNQSIVVLGNKTYDLFVVTVEPEPDPSPNPDDRIVLAGYWPGREPANLQLTATAAAIRQTPGATPPTPSGTVVTTQLPTGLPRTGGPGFEVLAGALAVLSLGAAALLKGGHR
jgi:hypothetical protein